MFVGNNWAGTATVVDADTLEVLRARRSTWSPTRSEELAAIRLDPERLALLPRRAAGARRGPRPVRRRHVHHPRRPLPRRVPAEPGRRRVDRHRARPPRATPAAIVREQQMDGHRTDHMGLSPDGTPAAGQRLHRPPGHRVRHGRRDARPTARSSRWATGCGRFESGETPHENNYSDDGRKIFHASIGRVYTPGDHGTARRGPGQGRPLVPGRARPRLPHPPALGHGQGARRGRLPGHEPRRTADGARSGRAVPLLPGLLLPRLRRVRHPCRRPQRRGSTTRSGTKAEPPPWRGHPRRHPCPTGCRRCRWSSTSTTPRTTGCRWATTTAPSARPARWTTTPRWSNSRTTRRWIFDRADHGPRLPQALLDDRRPERHVLDLAQRVRRGRRPRRTTGARSWPTSRWATTRSGCGTGWSAEAVVAGW